MVSSWWQSVRDILSQSVLIGQSLVMAVVCRSVAMELNAATQKIKVMLWGDFVILSAMWENCWRIFKKHGVISAFLKNRVTKFCEQKAERSNPLKRCHLKPWSFECMSLNPILCEK